MFGFGRKKAPVEPPTRPKREKSTGEKERINDELAKLGLGIIPGIDDEGDSDVDDADLEDELLAIMGGEAGPKAALIPPTQKTKLPSNLLHLEDSEPEDTTPEPPSVMDALQERLVKTGSKYKLENDEFELPPPAQSGPVDIFKAPPPPQSVDEALQQRLGKYKSELAKATAVGEGGKVRRMGRIVKQYEEAIVSHRRGKPVDFDELPVPPGFGPIPVPGATTTSAPPPVVSQTSVPSLPLPLEPIRLQSGATSGAPPPAELPEVPALAPEKIAEQLPISETTLEILSRQKEYKEAAMSAKKCGNLDEAREFLRMAKGFDKFVQESQARLPVDLASLPRLSEGESPITQLPVPVPANVVQEVPVEAPAPSEEAGPSVDIFQAPPPPATIMEALQQRLEKYKSEVEKATETANTSKARRMGRIVKQYEEAITAHKRGRPILFDELPTPPGFGPIPVPGSAPAAVPVPSTSVPAPPQQPAASAGVSPTEKGEIRPSHTGSINRGGNKPQTKLTLQEKQLATILGRQKQFKAAALNAKKRGDVDQAREFLRTAMGFEKLIQASQAGLPVDMATLPSPPEAVALLESEDFEIVTQSDCIPATGSSAEIFAKLEEDLRNQLKMCMRTRDHFKSMGDIASANRFEKMALETKADLDILRMAARKGEGIPKYHYETKIFSINECNADLTEDEIEINILKGINFKVTNPTDVDTFVKIELPYPSAEEVQSTKTSVVKDTNNPDYGATFKMSINRSARNFQRFVHRHGFKLEVWSKGGLFSRSTLLGVATVKLMPLETKCNLHDAFDILDGRKPIGKLEVKIRIREPVLTKQITQKKEKWLSIDRV